MKDVDLLNAFLVAAILGNEKNEKKEEQPDELRKKAEDLGNKLYHCFLGFMDAGFNEEQAIRLTAAMAGRN